MNIFCKVTNAISSIDDESEKSECKHHYISNEISDDDMKKLFLVEFKSQSYASFYNTSMEKDKSILTLSVAGIGFLVTLLNFTKNVSLLEYSIFIVASLSFLVAIYCVITLFGRNADFIIDLTKDRDVTLKEHNLRQLDKWAIRSFYLGIVASLILGVFTSTTLINKGSIIMSNKENITESKEISGKPSTESFKGASDIGKSLSGASDLAPQVNSEGSSSTPSSGGASDLKPEITPSKKD